MSRMKTVISIDPSGNFEEGKGKTGIIVAHIQNGEYTLYHKDSIDADKFHSRTAFWAAHLDAIDPSVDQVIVEDYRLYPHIKQGYSLMETPRLLGVIEMHCDILGIPIVFQTASQTTGYSDSVLLNRGILEKRKGRYWLGKRMLNDHERSALRHFLLWYNKEKKNEHISKENQPKAV